MEKENIFIRVKAWAVAVFFCSFWSLLRTCYSSHRVTFIPDEPLSDEPLLSLLFWDQATTSDCRCVGLFLCVCAHNSLSCHIFQWKHSLCLCSKLHAVIYLLCRKYPKVTLYTSDLVLSSLSVSSLLISHQPPPCSLLCSGHWSIWSCSPHIGC